MQLWENLTGGDVRFAGRRLSPLNYADRAEYVEFRNSYAGALAEYMAVEGERLLLRHSIDEPVTWQPEPADPAGQAWRSLQPILPAACPAGRATGGREDCAAALAITPPAWRVLAYRAQRLPRRGSDERRHTPTLFDNPVATSSFLIDLANWPAAGQIYEKLAK